MSILTPSPIGTDRHLPSIVSIAIEAGRIVQAGFEAGCAFRVKTDASPVTEFDQAAEALIGRRLAVDFPDIEMVAEEEVAQGHVPPDLGRRFFLVDPLDGTKEFVAGLPDFTVNIALVEDGVPICGVVLAPAHGDLFVGSGAGAFKACSRGDGTWTEFQPIETRERPQEIVALASRSHFTPATDLYLKQLPIGSIVPMGSSLKYCRIAEGTADFYPCLGRTMEWDIAAAHAVLKAAGGDILDLDGRPMRYGKRGRPDEADFANPSLVAAGRNFHSSPFLASATRTQPQPA